MKRLVVVVAWSVLALGVRRGRGDGEARAATGRPSPADGAAQIAVGPDHSCVRLLSGSVRCWGTHVASLTTATGSPAGTIGNPDRFPVAVAALAGAEDLALDSAVTCMLLRGAIHCQGDNQEGRLGDGTSVTRLSPRPVRGVRNVAQFSVGGMHGCAVLKDGTVRCWGSNQAGEIGDGTTKSRVDAWRVSGLTDVAEVTCGMSFSCARQVDGRARCWGLDDGGQLGTARSSHETCDIPEDGPTPCRKLPTVVSGLADAVEIGAGERHACARLGDGTMRCWGDDATGQLGGGLPVAGSSGLVDPGLTDVVQISVGASHTCARLKDKTVKCWGWNDDGQLGDGSTETRKRPVSVVGLRDVEEVAAGYLHTCARMADGSVLCWGDNRWGQLGVGAVARKLRPSRVTLR